MNDVGAVRAVVGGPVAESAACALDDKTRALVRVAGLVALGSEPATYQWGVGAAFAAGASADEIVDVLVAVAPVVGAARAMSAAVDVGRALGYEVAPGDSE
jgi:4-carboxymuconolactone decarboxylase